MKFILWILLTDILLDAGGVTHIIDSTVYSCTGTHTRIGLLQCPLNNCKTVDNVEFVAYYVGVVAAIVAAVGDDDGGGGCDAENNIVDDVINQFPWTNIHFHSHWNSYSPRLISSIPAELKHSNARAHTHKKCLHGEQKICDKQLN